MKPRCYMSTRPDGIVRLCSWCPDIKQGNEWAESRGYEVTHGICRLCADKINPFPVSRKGALTPRIPLNLGN